MQSTVACTGMQLQWCTCSLVPRPRPAFRRLQYGNFVCAGGEPGTKLVYVHDHQYLEMESDAERRRQMKRRLSRTNFSSENNLPSPATPLSRG